MAITALIVIILGVDYGIDKSRSSEFIEIEDVIDKFQEAYSGKQVNDIRQLFYADAVIAYDSGHGEKQNVFSLEEWLQGTEDEVFAKNDYISDVLSNREVVVLRNIAYATCDYTYKDDDGTQKGVDVITFLKMRDRWRILSLQWTGDKIE